MTWNRNHPCFCTLDYADHIARTHLPLWSFCRGSDFNASTHTPAYIIQRLSCIDAFCQHCWSSWLQIWNSYCLLLCVIFNFNNQGTSNSSGSYSTRLLLKYMVFAASTLQKAGPSELRLPAFHTVLRAQSHLEHMWRTPLSHALASGKWSSFKACKMDTVQRRNSTVRTGYQCQTSYANLTMWTRLHRSVWSWWPYIEHV